MVQTASVSPFIQTLSDGATGWLILNRPERRNALNRDMWAAIPRAIAGLELRPETRVIVVRGAGEEAFASGADITEFAESRQDATAATTYEALNGAAFAAIRAASKPVVAMIHGFCFGGGLALALACDLRIASDKAVFSLPPARLGLAYPLDGLADLLAAVPLATAKEMIFTARRMAAADALTAGLVNRVVPGGRLDAAVAELCSRDRSGCALDDQGLQGRP